MILKMKRHAARRDSGTHQVKIRIPTDVRDRARGRRLTVNFPASATDSDSTFAVTLGEFCKGSLHTRDARTADVRRLLVAAALGTLCDALRRGPVPLSQRQVEALAGEVHKLLLDEHGDDPGTPRRWESFKALTRAAVEGRIPGAPPIPDRGQSDDETMRVLLFGDAEGDALTETIDGMAATWPRRALEQRVGRLAYWVMQRHGLEVEDDVRLELLRRIAVAALQAGATLKRMAGGDYRPDPTAERFPVFEKAKTPTKGVTLWGLFERWQAERKPAPSSVSTWRGVIRSFERHVGGDIEARTLTRAQVIGWVDTLIAEGRDPSAINDHWLAALNALLNIGVAKDLLAQNVAKGVRMTVKAKAGERMLPYTDEEIARLLDHASRQSSPAKRWLPMLAVLTGARVGELAQLWGGQITEVDGVPVIEIRPAQDGATLKNAASERTVPIHPSLIEVGFLAFVRAKGDRPLFYARPARRGLEAKHPSKGVSNHLASWIRTLPGFDDARKAPAHACRHWFKTMGARLELMDSLVNAIQGHTDSSTAGTYRHFSIAQMAAAIERYPVPSLAKGETDGAVEVGIGTPITSSADVTNAATATVARRVRSMASSTS